MEIVTKINISAGIVILGILTGVYSMTIPEDLVIAKQDIFVQLRIQQDTEFGQLNDADYLSVTDEQRAQILEILGISEKDLEDLARERVGKYIFDRQEAKDKPKVEPTQEEWIAHKQSLIDQKVTIDAEILDIENKLNQ